MAWPVHIGKPLIAAKTRGEPHAKPTTRTHTNIWNNVAIGHTRIDAFRTHVTGDWLSKTRLGT